MEIFELPLAYRILYYHHGRLEIKYVLRSLNILLFHFTLRLSINSIIGFLFPKVWHLDNFERPVDIHNHASWYVCKVTLWACKDYKHCLWSSTTHNKCYSRDELYSTALSWNWAWSIGIMTSKVFCSWIYCWTHEHSTWIEYCYGQSSKISKLELLFTDHKRMQFIIFWKSTHYLIWIVNLATYAH